MSNTNNASHFILGTLVTVGDDVRVDGIGIARVLAFVVEGFASSSFVDVLAGGRRSRVSVLAVRP